MIEMPDFLKAFEYENNFYLSCDNTRIAKFLVHYELFKMIGNLPGAIVECGVFKGLSFVRFATFREIFKNSFPHKLVGFDTFGKFPETNFNGDNKLRDKFLQEAGNQSIAKEQLLQVLDNKGIVENIELVKGDIVDTIPGYLKNNPHLEIALLNIDVDLYEPSKAALEHLWPKIVRGGVCILDDYTVFPGATKAADDYFKGKGVPILKFPFANKPCYVVKPERPFS